KAEAEAFAQRFLDCVSAESDGERFVDQVFTKLKAEEPRNVPRPPRQATRRAAPRHAPAATPFPWRELGIAAGVLAAIGVLYALLSPSPAAAPRRSPEIVRPPERPEAPAPRNPEPVVPVENDKPVPPEPLPPAPTPDSKEPAPPPPPKPTPAPVRPVEKVEPAAPRTITTVASLEKVDGEVLIGRAAARAGDGIPAGEAVETSAAKGSAVVKFADGTRLELGADTLLREITQPAQGRRVMIARGSIVAEVAKQPAEQPMIFATPHGEARVL